MKVKCNFLFWQAGELDILTAVLKWGEHHLVKKIEERGLYYVEFETILNL
jgi:hypothetical protein